MSAEPLPIDLLLTADQRRLNVALAASQPLNPMPWHDLAIDPYVSGTNSRRSDKDMNRMLSIIDNLPINPKSKDGHQ